MNSTPFHVLPVGLPEAGKTSFLAALYHALESEEVPTRVLLKSAPKNRAYLNQIRDAWQKTETTGRTMGSTFEPQELDLEFPGGRRVQLAVPDFSGEVFQNIWLRHIAPARVVSLMKAADGIVLFLHSAKLSPHTRVSEAYKILREAGLATAHSSDEPKKPTPPFDPLKSPTETQLTEILQVIRAAAAPRKTRTAVVISAWDLVTDGKKPATWLEANVPLLHQYLTCNSDAHPFRAFGLSALGGDIGNPVVRDALLKKNNPTERIQCVEGNESSCDITKPLLWLLDSSGNSTQ